MNTQIIWCLKLLLAHLTTDFILQPTTWVRDRKARHFKSEKLYLHGLVTAIVAWCFIGWEHWIIALVIFFTHTIIDGWKSYLKDTIRNFLLDQLLHIVVLFLCWYFSFLQWELVKNAWQKVNNSVHFWAIAAAVVFLTTPAGILIGQLTRQWREKIKDAESLSNAGKWIGITERVIVLILVCFNQYAAIGLLVTAKGIIRFNEKDRQEIKTEYLVIGTLLSIGLAIVTGLILKTGIPATGS